MRLSAPPLNPALTALRWLRYRPMFDKFERMSGEERIDTPYFAELESPRQIGMRAMACAADAADALLDGGCESAPPGAVPTALLLTHSTVLESVLVSLSRLLLARSVPVVSAAAFSSDAAAASPGKCRRRQAAQFGKHFESVHTVNLAHMAVLGTAEEGAQGRAWRWVLESLSGIECEDAATYRPAPA